ncbi:sensor histidine kinase KdpD [Bacteroides helcogenes]|uniref:histidine kinase n=1 Tax=Bacteroides helcogenes (strain ATCC 35417 / DSM 20613 / JCM 6297 / CCUG 15421 / P 36-108) TaxID=693979 RepID=E6SUV0_BACT6|nr:HAMP domain-containing sensor histidine kinase [Bacteroides helcogenes]ADV44445.1 integral membrane sensor signal transduction histidine kinase [Bacteroides helcogenes P 36-108]MDY5237095.1 HAMP domain-containing sensor histidine kinase [Bacteroides helcogenes]
MKLPSKYIVILVILSLTGIFTYQAYWLTNLYHTQKRGMEQSILEALRICDFNEMILRIKTLRKNSTDHGEVNVSAGFSDDGRRTHTYVSSSTVFSHTDKDSAQMSEDTILIKLHKPKQDSISKTDTFKSDKPQSSLHTNAGLSMILENKNNITELSYYFQRGLHSGIDILTDPDTQVFDSLLTLRLHEAGITLPHRLEYLYTGSKEDSSCTFTDTLAVLGTPGYMPTSKAKNYEYSFDLYSHHLYRLTMEPVTLLVLKQMTGILATSFVILIILGFSFGFLIRTILRQKTLEEMKSDFTNNITHELKTPIAVAYAANDALLNFNQAEEKIQRDKYLRICQEQLQRLSGLVEQILSMSMERRKTFRLHREDIEVRGLLEKLVEQHKLKADKSVEISLDIKPDDLTVNADRMHMGNIVSNLIDNAIKYSPGKAVIDIRCRPVTSPEYGRQTEISVRDHGTGITADKLQHVFDKFYRIPTGNLHNMKGYGLGLFYVKTLTEKHGGSVSVESESNKGSVFTIKI